MAPRLSARSPGWASLEDQATACTVAVQAMAQQLSGVSCVVNAAGLAAAGANDLPAIYGANTLMPRVVQLACRQAGVYRYVHVSSAAVQGRIRLLDETSATYPFSHYSRSKALAEAILHDLAGVHTVIFRPTSVHGPTRDVTQTLIRFARSSVASVAGKGHRPTPQVLVQNVGAAIAFTSLDAEPPRIVLQPWEGMTTAGLMRALGGREPLHVPDRAAQALLTAVSRLAGRRARLASQVRRLEMVWFGQGQEACWLSRQGWVPPVGLEGWHALADEEEAARDQRDSNRPGSSVFLPGQRS